MEGIGTIHVDFGDPVVDQRTDTVVIRATHYYGATKWSETIRHPIADLDVTARVEEANDVVFHGTNDGYFYFVDADHYDPDADELLDMNHVDRVPIPESLLPPP